jgi:hypothetical protein
MGAAYHWAFFARINPLARVFGALFILEGLLLWSTLRSEGLRFGADRDVSGVVGGLLIGYALLVYPVLGTARGHLYPAQPTFGLPCPTTLFTIGVLLWARPRVLRRLLVIPVLWSLVGASAVAFFGVMEDAMLPVAGIVGGALLLGKGRRTTVAGGAP